MNPNATNEANIPNAPERGYISALKVFSHVASILTMLVGICVLAGWIFDSTMLKGVFPGLVFMNPFTALCMILCGLSLWCVLPEQASTLRLNLASVCSGVVTIIGAGKLVEFAAGWTIQLDRILFVSRLGANQMAPNTALDFLLFGIALLLLSRRRGFRHRPAQFFTMLAGLIALLALTGYAYSAGALYQVGNTIPMALNTAITFLILASGILAARPERGLMAIVTSPSAGGIMLRRMLPPVMGLPLFLGACAFAGTKAGLYTEPLAFSLLAVWSSALFGGLIWLTATSLHASDSARSAAQLALQAVRDELEERVEVRTGELAEVNFSLQAEVEDNHKAHKELEAAHEELESAHSQLERAAEDRKRFYRDVIRAVTKDKFCLAGEEDIPECGDQFFSLDINSEDDLKLMRHKLRELALKRGMTTEATADMVLACGEATSNALKHGTDAHCSVFVAPHMIVIRVSDKGQGIKPENLPATILSPGFSTQVSLGMGYTLMLQLVERVWLATGVDGTTVQLEKWFRPEETPDATMTNIMGRFGAPLPPTADAIVLPDQHAADAQDIPAASGSHA